MARRACTRGANALDCTQVIATWWFPLLFRLRLNRAPLFSYSVPLHSNAHRRLSCGSRRLQTYVFLAVVTATETIRADRRKRLLRGADVGENARANSATGRGGHSNYQRRRKEGGGDVRSHGRFSHPTHSHSAPPGNGTRLAALTFHLSGVSMTVT